MTNNEIIILKRDTMARMVPAGAMIMLHEGTQVRITQSLGNTFTVDVFGNLARIDGKDADALGKEIVNPMDDLPEDATTEDKVWSQLQTVFDPEIPVNIVDLGLVYTCSVQPKEDGNFHVNITMTLTAPGCGMGPVIAEDAKHKILVIPEVSETNIEIVFEPPWDRSMMSETAKLELGLF